MAKLVKLNKKIFLLIPAESSSIEKQAANPPLNEREWPFGRQTVKKRVTSGLCKKGKEVHGKKSVITEKPRQGYHLQLHFSLDLYQKKDKPLVCSDLKNNNKK